MSEPTIYNLLDQIDELKWADPLRLVLSERAVQMADSQQIMELQFRARTELIAAATGVGAVDKSIVACAWCVAQQDFLEDADYYIRYLFLWNMKMVLHGICSVPQISRAQIDEITSQMSHLHRKHGYNQRATEYIRFCHACAFGDDTKAKAFYASFLEIPRDGMADCGACETDSQVSYLGNLKRDKEAIAIAQPIIGGKLSCTEIPHGTYCNLLQPLLRQNKRDLADQYHKMGYAKVRSNRFMISAAVFHIGYDVFCESWSRAITRLERLLPIALTTPELDERYECFVVTEWLMEQLADRGRARKSSCHPIFHCTTNLTDMIVVNCEIGLQLKDSSLPQHLMLETELIISATAYVQNCVSKPYKCCLQLSVFLKIAKDF